jgi:hypothetical protein
LQKEFACEEFYHCGRIINMAIEITMKHTTATKNVYPATSPNHILVTANIGIAKNDKILVYGNY